MGKILLAVQSNESGEILRSFENYCAKKKREDVFELATSVIQIRQLLADGEYTGMILQYQLGAVPFTAEEVVSFHNTNEKMAMVIIVPNEIKSGTFLNSLLVEDIRGALYASEGRPSKVMGLLDEGRTRTEAKAYYGILDTVVSAKEANELPQYATAQNIANYKAYLETGEDRPLKERFEYIASKVSMQEVKDMVNDLDPDMIDELRKFPGLAAYLPPLPAKEDKKKKVGFLGGLFGRKKDDEPKSETKPEPEATKIKEDNSTEIKNDTVEKPKAPKKAFEKPARADEDEPVKESPKVPEPAADEDDYAAELSEFFDLNVPVSVPEPAKKAPEKKPDPKPAAAEPEKKAQKPVQNGPTERERAEAERKRLLEEERIKREEKIRNEATKTLKEENERQKAEAERRAREEKERHEAERERLLKEQQETEARAKAEAERLAAEAEQEKARIESEYQKKIEEEKRAREEAERNAKAEAERKAKEDARRIAEAEKLAQMEKERAEAEKARLLKEQQAKEQKLLAEKAKREAELKAEAERAKAEAERKAREESARIEAEYRAKVEAERKAREEAEKEAERKAKEAEKRIQIAEANVRTVIKKQMVSRRVVGIFGIYKGFDAVPAAVQLAKTLSQYEPVTYIEVPRESHGVYTRYNLAKGIGPSFKSVPHMAAKGEADFSTVRNLFSDISFYVANDAYGEVEATPQTVAAMVNGTSDNIVLETGCTLDEARKLGIVNLCTKAVLIFDRDEEERYMARIREAAEVLEASGIEPYLMAVSAKGNEVSTLSNDLLYSPIKRSNIEGQVSFLDMKIPEQNKLLEYLGLEGAAKVKRKKQSVRIEIMGTKDIAVFGAERGNGVTHTCLMLADSVRRDYKVAMLELNPTRHMANLAKELNQEDGTGRMNLYGIDVFYGMSYQKFATNFRPQYQIVIIDFGTYSNATSRAKGNVAGNRELFISCTKKYLVFDASPWRLAVLDQLVNLLDTDSDPSGQIELLAPMTTPSGLKQYNLYNRVGGRDIHCMPDCEMPVKCDDRTADFMRKLVLK